MMQMVSVGSYDRQIAGQGVECVCPFQKVGKAAVMRSGLQMCSVLST